MRIWVVAADEARPVRLHDRHDRVVELTGVVRWWRTAVGVVWAPDCVELDGMTDSDTCLYLEGGFPRYSSE